MGNGCGGISSFIGMRRESGGIRVTLGRLRLWHSSIIWLSARCSGRPAESSDKYASVVSHKRLELFSLAFAYFGAGATGLDGFEGLLAAT